MRWSIVFVVVAFATVAATVGVADVQARQPARWRNRTTYATVPNSTPATSRPTTTSSTSTPGATPLSPSSTSPSSTTPSSTANSADLSRYRWHQGCWWYHLPNDQWVRWNGLQWVGWEDEYFAQPRYVPAPYGSPGYFPHAYFPDGTYNYEYDVYPNRD